MAFLNRVGNLLKQKVTKHVTSQFSASNSSLFQAIRSMSSSSKLFVGGLSYSTDEMSLREAFSQYGEVVEVRVILDRETGRSRGFGFITYTSSEAASSAIQAFDGQDLHGRRIRVNYATEKPRGGGFGGGFGAGGGFNYGGQGGNYGRGGYQGGNYPGGDGSFGGGDGGYGGGNQYPSGGGGYGSGNQYPSGGGGFGSGNQYPGGAGGSGGADNYPSGGGSGYGGGDSVQGDGNYGGGGSSYFSGSQTGFSSLLNDEKTGENQEPLGDGPQGGIDAGNDNFGQDISDEENRNNDEQNDHVNTRS